MLTKRYPLTSDGPARLEISLEPNFDSVVRLDGNVVARLRGRNVCSGVGVPLANGANLEIKGVVRKGEQDLVVSLAGTPLPGSAEGNHGGDRQMWGQVLFGLLVLVGLGFALWRGGGALVRGLSSIRSLPTPDSRLAVYEQAADSFLEVPGLATALLENPSVDGPVLLIDKTEKKLYTSCWKPDALPADPDDIRYVAWIECADHLVGSYSDGKPAYRSDCAITLIDRDQTSIIARKEVAGFSPPLTKTKSSIGGWGERDDQAICMYVESLVGK